MSLHRFEPCDYVADPRAPFFGNQIVERVLSLCHMSLSAGPFFPAQPARVGPEGVEPEIHSGPVEPSGRIAARGGALLKELVKRIRGQFLRLRLVADQTQQSSHQPGIMFREKIFKGRIRPCLPRSYGRAEAQKGLFTGVHTDVTTRAGEI